MDPVQLSARLDALTLSYRKPGLIYGISVVDCVSYAGGQTLRLDARGNRSVPVNTFTPSG